MKIEISGKVVKEKFASGTKSEHDAVMLATGINHAVKYKLRRLEANPFSDPELDKLVGLFFRVEGDLEDQTIFVSTYTQLEEA